MHCGVNLAKFGPFMTLILVTEVYRIRSLSLTVFFFLEGNLRGPALRGERIFGEVISTAAEDTDMEGEQ